VPGDGEGIVATVTRLMPLGMTTRVELKGHGAGVPEYLEAECLRAESTALQPGDRVAVLPIHLRVFEQPEPGTLV
jgi:hypothetical protein